MNTGRYSRVNEVTAVINAVPAGKEFTAKDIAAQLPQYTTPQVARTIVDLVKVKEPLIAAVATKRRPEGGKAMNVYCRKAVSSGYKIDAEVGGVWSDLFMKPVPVPKGRVHSLGVR